MILDSKKAYKNLKKKGFIDSESHSCDHKYLDLFFEGKYIGYTKLSHGSGDLTDYLIKQMSDQCKLSKQQFADLVNCPLSKDDYIEILRGKGYLD